MDRFADFTNKKLCRFNSRYFHPAAEATDAFTQDWALALSWIVPPIYMVTRAIEYLRLCRASGIIVVPIWVSAYFWPTIIEMFQTQKRHITGHLTLGNIFRQYGNKNSVFGSTAWRSDTLVVGLDFSEYCKYSITRETALYTPIQKHD